MAYNGSDDPHDHVAAFQTQMFISSGDEAVNCKMFARTMKDVVLCWYGLPPSSIANCDDLTSGFTTQFSASRGKQTVLSDLHQGQSEPLKSFLSCFNNIIVLVDEPDGKFFVVAFLKGLHT